MIMTWLVLLIIVLMMIWYLMKYEDLSPDYVNCEKCNSLVVVNWVRKFYHCKTCGYKKNLKAR